MVAHHPDFQRGIAMVLQGESLKASCYVTHAASLGALREKMVSSFVRQETPERYRVETGLIRNHQGNISSRQCDLLVHEPAHIVPLYRWEDYVVVHDEAARAVVEVKSDMDKSGFEDFLNVHISVIMLEAIGQGKVFIPTFGYGLTGITCQTLANYLQVALTTNRLKVSSPRLHLNWPVCVAIQSRNYIGVRPLHLTSGKPLAFCIADFSKVQEASAGSFDGIETGLFLEIYSGVLLNKRPALDDSNLYNWFNGLPLTDAGKIWVTEDGVSHTGNIP
jgi:hypothetical protein